MRNYNMVQRPLMKFSAILIVILLYKKKENLNFLKKRFIILTKNFNLYYITKKKIFGNKKVVLRIISVAFI